MAQVLQALALRHPLPEPTGLVGPGGVLVPNSKKEAMELVESINSETQRTHDQAISVLQGQLTSDLLTQVADSAKELPQEAKPELGALNAPLEDPSPPGATGGSAS